MMTRSPEISAPLALAPAQPLEAPWETEAPPTLTLRERLGQSRIARAVLGLATTTGLLATATTFEASPAQADEVLVYTVQDTEVGIFARNSPHENDTDRVVGKGAYDGDRIELLCGITNGDPVGPYNNHT